MAFRPRRVNVEMNMAGNPGLAAHRGWNLFEVPFLLPVLCEYIFNQYNRCKLLTLKILLHKRIWLYCTVMHTASPQLLETMQRAHACCHRALMLTGHTIMKNSCVICRLWDLSGLKCLCFDDNLSFCVSTTIFLLPPINQLDGHKLAGKTISVAGRHCVLQCNTDRRVSCSCL